MRHLHLVVLLPIFCLSLTFLLLLSSQSSPSEPLTIALSCSSGYCPLLEGSPQTVGMRSGLVRLAPGEAVGWHSTGQHEEVLVILHGCGQASIKGRASRPLAAPMLAYIPPATEHNVENTGTGWLEYVYVVAPVQRE